MQDTQLCLMNIQHIVENVLNGVETISNKKRKTKNSESYLYCGGGYDTESTTVLNDYNKPKFAFVYHIQIMINGTYIYFRDLNLLTPFIKQLQYKIDETYDEKTVLIIWVANLAHEWAFFKRQLSKVGITDIFAKNKRNPLKIKCGCVEFRECLGLFGKSLDDLAKTYTKTQKLKGDLDYSKIRTWRTILTQEEYNYCRNDVQILNELSYVAFDKFTKKGLKIPMTQTGILRQKCKNAIFNYRAECNANEKLMPKDEKTYYEFRRFLYAGGLSGSNVEYVSKKLIHVKGADLTSDYPAQMNHHLYPSGELIECKPDEIFKHKHQFRIFEVFVQKMQSRCSHAVFSKHKIMNFEHTKNAIISNGKVQYIENAKIMINNVDLEALTKIYNFTGFFILRCWYFTKKAKAPKFLLKCMNEDYLLKHTLKEKLKTLKYGTEEYIKTANELKEVKARVNAYYGMCATRLYDCIYKYDEKTQDIEEKSAEKEYEELKQNVWLNPYVAYWCTSYARKILIDMIVKYPRVIVQYDTDSFYYRTDLPETENFENDLRKWNDRKLMQNKAMFDDSAYDDLGAWEIDKEEHQYFKCLGAKRYIYKDFDIFDEKETYMTYRGVINPVVAGLPKNAFKKYVQKNNIDPFKLFDNDMVLNRIDSNKLASSYYDGEPFYTKITDCDGFEDICEIGTYHALYNIEFSLKMSADYLNIVQQIEEEKGLPEKFRNVSHETFSEQKYYGLEC